MLTYSFTNIGSDHLYEHLYKCIKNEPANINQIVRKTKMSIQDISYKIMLLQLENLIEELPGQVYRIKNGEDDE